MASSEILSQTLLAITQSKLSQLDKQKTAYETGKRQLEERVAAETADGKRTRALIAGATKLPTMTPLSQSPMLSLANFDRFMQQAQNDPSVTREFILECEVSIRKELDIQTTKYDYASLYGKLVNEWISSGKKEDKETPIESSSVGREEARIQRETWEGYVFNPKQTDEAAIKTYLSNVFESEKAVKEMLDKVRKEMGVFQENWDCDSFDADTVRSTIKGMLRSDVLTDIKRSTLTDFLDNKVVCSEIADVLNMRMKTWESWAWDSDLIIDQRRNLNGRYRFYPDEDLLQSIFIYNIGLRWAVQLREMFSRFLDKTIWKSTLEPISEADQKRLLKVTNNGSTVAANSIVSIKDQHFENKIFLDQLPQSLEEQRGAYGSKNDAEQGDSRESHLDVSQKLLHMIQADIIVASGDAPSTSTQAPDRPNRLCKPVTVIRSDFKWFGPSLPHSSITTVLKFFGVNQQWLDFFIKVLEAPLRFKQDADSVLSRTRKRGTPISTPLADVFGESLLFCVDFAVNQKADGARLYRLHDDMWLWGDVEVCKKSWAILTECAEVLGLEFNTEKTGSATVLSSQAAPATGPGAGLLSDTTNPVADVDTALPQGDVTWGFLKLDAESGRFVISQEDVDQHIDELKLQLAACKSVFDWIQAWNIYGVRFFSNFFGKPANCYSRQHIDSMLETFQRIQQALFPDTPGGAGEHVRQMISKRFAIPTEEIPDGYIYFPIELGGLGLQNPFIGLCLVRDSVAEDPKTLIGNHAETEEGEYRDAKLIYESSWKNDDEPFLSREDYSLHRERISRHLGTRYSTLMCEANPANVEQRGEIRAILEPEKWRDMSSYDKWVVSLYGREMLAKFGGINVVDKGLLPTGMMDMLRQSKFQWVG